MASARSPFCKCTSTPPLLGMVLQATDLASLARLLALSTQWKQRVSEFLQSMLRHADIQADGIARCCSEEVVGFLTRYCSRLQYVRLGCVDAPVLLQLQDCTERLLLLDVSFYIGGFSLPLGCYFQSWTSWMATGWQHLRVLILEDDAEYIEDSPEKLVTRVEFANVLDAIALHCQNLTFLSVRMPVDTEFDQIPPVVSRACARFLESVLRFPSLWYLDLDLPFMDSDLSGLNAAVSAPIHVLRLIGADAGLNDQLCEYSCRIFAQASTIFFLTVDGTSVEETANVMEALRQHCHRLRILHFDGCEGLALVVQRLTEEPECCPQLQYLELQPAEPIDDAVMGEPVRVLEQTRPSMKIWAHASEDKDCSGLSSGSVREKLIRMAVDEDATESLANLGLKVELL